MRRNLGPIVLLASMLLASCGDGAVPTTPDDSTSTSESASPAADGEAEQQTDDASWPEGTWRLISGSGEEPIEPAEDAPITLTLVEEEQCWSDELPCWSGNDGCNQYVATVERVGEGGIRVDELLVTDMACSGDGWREPAERYTEALLHVDRYSLTDDDLQLSGPGIELVYEEA